MVNVLIESEILAKGSANSFLSGKHFNRCKKIHPLASLVIKFLHIDRFLKYQSCDIESVKQYLVQFGNEKTAVPQITDQVCLELFRDYESYREETIKGKHGKTPQIFMIYVQLVEYYLIMEFSIRTGDINLYKHILPKIANVFFSMNHPNYARYLTIYHDKLENIETTHPGLLQSYGSSFLGIRRTAKNFSRLPIDLTLEQTINADAASRASGTVNMTNSFSARQRWSITHSLRTSIISKCLEFCDMITTDDVTKDLKNSSIVTANKNIKALLEMMAHYTNPFSRELSKDHLYNIATGQSVTNEIYEFLSTVETSGKKQREQFIAECKEDPERFDKVLSKNKILNFASKNRRKIKVNGKIQEVRLQRDIFGRLLHASISNNIDVEKALSYPLSPIPFSFCHSDGTICETVKSIVLEELKKYQENITDPPEPDISIVDGFYLLHTLKNVPDSYHKISKYILTTLLFNRKEVYIIFDKYKTPSIKDCEHSLRGEDDTQYSIERDNKRPAEMSQLLRSANFKEKFIQFLIKDWMSDEYVSLCEGKIVKLNFDQCYMFEVVDNKMSRTLDLNNSCYHEEADTKIIHHICQLNGDFRVRIHCSGMYV